LKRSQLSFRNRVVDVGDGAVSASARRDGVERDPVVGAVDAGIDDHRAADAELGMQRPEILQRRIGRRIRPVRGIGIFRIRSEDVAVRIARERRQLELRRLCIRIGSGDCRLEHGCQLNLKRFAGFATRSLCCTAGSGA